MKLVISSSIRKPVPLLETAKVKIIIHTFKVINDRRKPNCIIHLLIRPFSALSFTYLFLVSNEALIKIQNNFAYKLQINITKKLFFLKLSFEIFSYNLFHLMILIDFTIYRTGLILTFARCRNCEFKVRLTMMRCLIVHFSVLILKIFRTYRKYNQKSAKNLRNK